MEEILKYFPDLSSKQIQQFEALFDLYFDWNSKINVISRKDMDNFYVNHVLHSLAIGKIVSFKDGSDILDLGTGGGFPGIPLAILFPKCNFQLVDSIGKKITVVNGVASAIGLENVKAYKSRVEEIDFKFDFVVTRAVARLFKLDTWIRDKFKSENINDLRNGIICLKGGDLDDEIREYNRVTEVTNLSDIYPFDFFETKKITYTGYIK